MAAGGVTVGSVWLDVLPSMRNFGGELASQAGTAGRAAGERTGSEMGEGTRSKFSGAVAGIAAVGATIGLAIGAAISQAIDISAGRAKLAAQLGLTAQESERYGAIAGKVYSGAYGDSLDQVNEALRGVNQNISKNLNDADLQGITQNVLNLASTFDVDLGGATTAVGQLMKTGLAPNATAAMDIITAGFQGGVDKAGDFLDTLNEYGTQFRKLGIDGTTATGLLSQGLQGGARDADLVADALKEFSIRAIDGSTTSAAGFQALGLSAKTMTAQIAQGGPAASAGLQTVLDRLRAMKDPVAQSAAATALFGTQAEDLGKALYSLDPSSAVAALGQVGGAADAMNTTLGDTASSKIESFKRTLETTFVNVVGGYVIPILITAANIIGTVFGPAVEVVGTILSTTVVPALQGFVGWLRDSSGWLVPVAVGVGAFVLALNAASIATGLWGLATSAASLVMGLARGAVLSFQLGVWLLNAAMAANPIGIVVALLVGLVAAIVVAYNSSDTFRGIVQGAFAAIMVAVHWLGDAFTWLWVTILQPVFAGIGLVIRIAAAIILAILIIPIVLAVNILGAIFTWLWVNVVQPIFTAIGALATWLWVNVLQPYFAAIGLGLSILGGFFTWLYDVAVAPAFSAIGFAAGILWAAVLQPVFAGIQTGLSAVGAFFGWVYSVLIKPALDGIGAAATGVWDSVLRPVFDGISRAVGAVGDAFGWAVDKISQVWGRIQEIVRPPVEFVVNAVYNGGIRPAWNFIAGLFDLGQLPELRFAKGGLVPGYAPGQDVVPALLSPGEAVLVPEAVRLLGAKNILALNHTARTKAGRASSGPNALANPAAGDVGYLGDYPLVQKFGDGGIVGWFWDTVGAVGDFVGGVADVIADPASAVRRAFAGIDTGPLQGVGLLSAALSDFVPKTIDDAITWLKSFIADSGVGDGNYGGALAWARTQVGKPYTWGGSGTPGWDCSGFMAAITNVIRGRAPARIGTTATMPWPGFTSGMNGAFVVGNSRNTGDGIGHMAGTLLGVPVETRGGDGTVVGPGSRGASNSLFGEHYTLQYDSGGMLPTGWSSVYNGTGSPEPVLTSSQWDAVQSGTGGGGDEFALTSGALEILDDGLVRVVDGRIQRVGTAISNGRRA